MLDFKGQAPKPAGSKSAQPSQRRHDWLADFDFLRALATFFRADWSTERMALRPIPIRVRDRR